MGRLADPGLGASEAAKGCQPALLLSLASAAREVLAERTRAAAQDARRHNRARTQCAHIQTVGLIPTAAQLRSGGVPRQPDEFRSSGSASRSC